MKKVVIDAVPHLCLYAVNDIHVGDQLLFDYGDVTYSTETRYI